MADKLMTFKYVCRNVAWQAGKSLTFMPKPIFEDNGSGMHVHQSLWKGGEPLFYDEAGYAGLSDLARWYIGGLLHHADARSEEHTSELQSLMRISYAVFCLKKKKTNKQTIATHNE